MARPRSPKKRKDARRKRPRIVSQKDGIVILLYVAKRDLHKDIKRFCRRMGWPLSRALLH